MEKIIETIKNIFRIPDLRKRILITFGILLVYRMGCKVLVPGIDAQALKTYFDSVNNNLLDMVNMFSGGALKQSAVFALGIMPYITSSIILQILQKSIPALERLAKEGEQGRNKINRYTRYLTVVFALLQSYGASTLLASLSSSNAEVVAISNTFLFRAVVMITLTTGAILIMWLGEKITESGIGNGISLIIFASIISDLPSGIGNLFKMVSTRQVDPGMLILVLGVILATVVGVVFFELGIRKIKIQYAKRGTSTGQTSGGSTYLPFKVNSAGVIPVIFSASVIQFPGIVRSLLTLDPEKDRFWIAFFDQFGYGRPLADLLFFITTVFFTFFYVDMLFNPKDTAENLKKNGGFIPGVRPGSETQKYIQNVLDRLTLWGALYLTCVSLVPNWIVNGLQLDVLPSWLGGNLFAHLPTVLNKGTQVTLAAELGGTSLLIMVSVALDFVNQIENQLVMRKYEGFTSGSKKAYMRTRRYA